MVQNMSLAKCETKTASQQTPALGLNLYHNVTNYVPNLLLTKQAITANPGNAETANRIGNEVVARGLKIRMQILSSPKRPNLNFKWFVFRYEANEPLNDALFWSGPAGAGGNNNRMLDFVDTRNITILKSGLVQNRNKVPPTDEGTINSVYRDIWIPLNNKKIKYNGNNSDLPKYTTIGMACLSYDANDSLQTDILNFWNYTSRFYFKDP
jgi:hypothetical protein